ncbi:MAG: helix-hairpin-helix domain-containing protein, partial [Promethearchaeota archaeon]
LPKNSNLLKIFQRVRDEAHRFAVKLHKKQREKRVKRSVLDDIKGIGPATRNKLLKIFGSVNKIKISSVEAIAEVVGKKLADTILKELND